MSLRRAVFLDRDGTIVDDPGYLADPAALRLLPGVELALKSLARAGYKLVVVSNQSGVARGLLTEETLEAVHGELRRQLSGHAVHLDGIHYCPFHPKGTVPQYTRDSDLRKPAPGMLLKAAEELSIDLRTSWMVGDAERDVEAGRRAGCRTILLTGEGAPAATAGQNASSAGGDAVPVDKPASADFTARNLVEAARRILHEDGQRPAAAEPSAGGGVKAAPSRTDGAAPQATAGPGQSLLKALAIVGQVLAVAFLAMALWTGLRCRGNDWTAMHWGLAALTLQVGALTYFLTRKCR